MKKLSIASLLSKKSTSRNERNSRAERVRTRALRLESLESRELLSVAPGSELLAVDNANICEYISAATSDDDLLDLSAAMLDGSDVAPVPSEQGATTIVVTSNLDVVDDADGVVTLREALASADSGDTITFASSLKGKTIALNPELGELTVNQSLTIDASNLWDATTSSPGLTISGQEEIRILRITGGTVYSHPSWGGSAGGLDVEIYVEINGITFANGYVVSDDGGAILCTGTTLSLNNCVICDNHASNGGGIYSKFYSNTTLSNCILTNNIARNEHGGAIYNDAVLSLNNCLISNNNAPSSSGNGGGIYSKTYSTTMLTNCTITNNKAHYGGGLYGDGTLTNCMIRDNEALKFGGGLYGGGTLTNCTITNNICKNRGTGGGVFSEDSHFKSYNSIIIGNITERESDPTVDVFCSYSGYYVHAYNTLSSFTGWSGENNLTYDATQPLFTDAASGDYTLADNSQAINKGNNEYATSSVDLEGNARIFGGTVDLGAYEYHKTIKLATPVVSVSDETKTTLTVSWDSVPNADRYSVSYKLPSETTWTNANAGTNLSYTIRGLEPNTEYDVRVKAIGDGVNYKSVYSEIVRASTGTTIITLEKPVVSVGGRTGTTITVSWNAVANAERYSFSYKPANETTWKNVNVGTNTNYTVTGLEQNSEYDVRVKAIGDGVDYKSVYSVAVRAETDATITTLAAPVVSVAGRTGTTITLKWVADGYAERYDLAYKPTNETTWTNVNVGTNTGYTIAELAKNTEYDVQLKAIGDGVVYKSVYSEVLRAATNATITPLTKPVVTVAGQTGTTIAVNWSAVSYADRYSLSYRCAGESTWKNVNVGTNLEYTISGLNSETGYDVRLKAIGDGVNYKSVYSSIVRAQTDASSSATLDLDGDLFDELDEEDFDLLARDVVRRRYSLQSA